MVLASVAVVLSATRAVSGLYATAMLYGVVPFALYPLCVAHTNDHLGPEERISPAAA